MSEPPSGGEARATPQEKEHLERAHHEICTALTVLRSNVELVRVELRHQADASTHVAVQHHLSELDMAVDRLNRLAGQLRAWHAEEQDESGGGPSAQGATRAAPSTRILP